MLNISDLKLKKLPELQEMGKKIGVKKMSTKKTDLIYQIIDHVSANPNSLVEKSNDNVEKNKDEIQQKSHVEFNKKNRPQQGAKPKQKTKPEQNIKPEQNNKPEGSPKPEQITKPEENPRPEQKNDQKTNFNNSKPCLLYTSPSPRDQA